MKSFTRELKENSMLDLIVSHHPISDDFQRDRKKRGLEKLVIVYTGLSSDSHFVGTFDINVGQC